MEPRVAQVHPDNGTPVARRVRKARGLSEAAQPPKECDMQTTTLDGLSVDQWLNRNEPAPSAPVALPPTSDVAQDGPRAARMPRVARVGAAMTWLAGLALGAVVALPGLAAGSSTCPPPGEGATYCHLQHDVLKAVMTMLLVTIAVVLTRRAIIALPGVIRRLRGEGLFPVAPSPTSYDDPLLMIACHGRVAGGR
jgi:hypothetical protein